MRRRIASGSSARRRADQSVVEIVTLELELRGEPAVEQHMAARRGGARRDSGSWAIAALGQLPHRRAGAVFPARRASAIPALSASQVSWQSARMDSSSRRTWPGRSGASARSSSEIAMRHPSRSISRARMAEDGPLGGLLVGARRVGHLDPGAPCEKLADHELQLDAVVRARGRESPRGGPAADVSRAMGASYSSAIQSHCSSPQTSTQR